MKSTRKKYYWKVARVRDDGRFESVITNTRAKCIYEVGKKTKAKAGKLFMFDTRDRARRWKGSNNNLRILKVLPLVKVCPSYKMTVAWDINRHSLGELRRLWSYADNHVLQGVPPEICGTEELLVVSKVR